MNTAAAETGAAPERGVAAREPRLGVAALDRLRHREKPAELPLVMSQGARDVVCQSQLVYENLQWPPH